MADSDSTARQDEAIAFLEKPASYPDRPERVDRIETHGALVFLAGERVYKIKRAVRLPYLDFSTLERRRAVCEREVGINRLTAPELYLGTRPIMRRGNGELALGGDGEPVEWAVEMKRFDQALLLDHMADEDTLPLAAMTPLADHIAGYHARAPVHRAGGVEALEHVIEQVAGAIEAGGDEIRETGTAGFARSLLRSFAGNRGLLAARQREGFVRRCHGDMHLRNIVMLDGAPTLFDAIEFDEDIATIDILYDFAFLLMDLWHRGKRRHANAVFNRYLWREGAGVNIAALRLMPMLLALRAGVRAMVALDRMDQQDSDDRHETRREASRYVALGNGFLAPAPPGLIATGGLSGTGKSTLAAALAPYIGAAPGALHLRSDVERKLLFGRAPEEKLGEEAYAGDATRRVYETLFAKAEYALASGHSVILDAVFANPAEREAAEDAARKAGVPFDGLWLTAERDELVRRVDAREGDASDADAEIVRRQLDYDLGEMTWQALDASRAPDEVAQAALHMLEIDAAPG